MTDYSWGGAVNTTAAFTNPPVYPYNDGIGMPTTRLAANGNRPIYISGVYADYISGDGVAQIVYGATVVSSGGVIFASSGGVFRFRIVPLTGTVYFGRNNAIAGSTEWSDGGAALSGLMPGGFAYSQSPTAPQSPLAAPGGASGSVDVSWAAPSDIGGSAITGYLIEWATDAGFTTGTGSKSVGVVTSDTVTALTPGLTYYFRIKAKNGVTNLASTTGVASGSVTASLGSVPDAPTSLVATAGIGLVGLTWSAPASDGGVAITSYTVERATDAGFTAGLVTVTGVTARAYTSGDLTPGTLYYFRVKAVNSVGAGAGATASETVPARGTLDVVQGAAVSVSGGIQVEVRSDGASPAVLTLGYTVFGTGTAFVTIATIPVGITATDFAASGNPRNLALVADPVGNLYVIGRRGDNSSTVLVKRYARSAPTTWALAGVNSQALASTGNALEAFAGAYVPGSGGSPVPTILLLARRAGTVGAGALSYATLDLAAIESSAGAAFLAYGSDPAWLSTPPTSSPANSATVDVAALVSGGTRLAIAANGFAVVDVVNGVVAGVSKSSAGTALSAPWAQVIGVSSNAFALLSVASGALSWAFYGTNGVVLGSGSIAGATAQGGAYARQWGAYLDSLAGVVTAYYVGSEAGARTLKSVDISPTTYVVTPATTLTAALGAASSTNGALRVPDGSIDERRVLVAADNLLTGTKSTATYSDRSGNITPNAPALVTLEGYDATQARVFSWAFSDPNSADTQSAYELVIERVSDSVVIVTSGKVVSATASRSVAAATLTNGVTYRWRVRTYDELDVVGAWSPYDSFVTSALGTLTITSPVSDNLVGIETSSYAVTWTYSQADGYTQTQRRVKVVRTSDEATLSDTTMQASTSGTYTVTGLPTDVEVRVEVSIITNAPSTPTVTATRLMTPSYGTPMTPEITVTPGLSYIEIVVTNPAPTGSRPEVVANYIDRRLATGTVFVAIARIAKDGGYEDHAVKSGVQYAYRVRGVTE